MKKMKEVASLCMLLALILISSCKSGDGFESIFNGSNLDGWIVKCTDQDSSKHYWFAENGCIVANSMGDSLHDYIWLQYDELLSDFQFRFKFQAEKTNHGNSGIQVRSRYDEDEQWLNGPQVDIHPSGPWRTGMMWDETRGYQRWIFPDLPKSEWVRPEMALNEAPFYYADDQPEWNEMEIVVQDNSIKSWLNGVLITDFNGSGILDDSIHASLGVGKEGYILLQIHVRDQLMMKYKDLDLKKL